MVACSAATMGGSLGLRAGPRTYRRHAAALVLQRNVCNPVKPQRCMEILLHVMERLCLLQLHSVDEKAEETACASNRSCAASFPTQVRLVLTGVLIIAGVLVCALSLP